MAKAKTAKQKAASKRNLAKARAARSRAESIDRYGPGAIGGSPKLARVLAREKASAAKKPIAHFNMSEKEIRTTNIMLGRKNPAKKAISGTKVRRGINSGRSQSAVDRDYEKAGYRSYPH